MWSLRNAIDNLVILLVEDRSRILLQNEHDFRSESSIGILFTKKLNMWCIIEPLCVSIWFLFGNHVFECWCFDGFASDRCVYTGAQWLAGFLGVQTIMGRLLQRGLQLVSHSLQRRSSQPKLSSLVPYILGTWWARYIVIAFWTSRRPHAVVRLHRSRFAFEKAFP